MLRLASDENLHGGIVRGLRRREPALDLVTVQEVGLIKHLTTRFLSGRRGKGACC